MVLVALFKNVRIPDLVRFLEYHLLLGVDRAVLVDNSCGAFAKASKAALAPYVAMGAVTHQTQFVCSEMRSMMFMHNFRGGSAMARQLSGLRDVPTGAFVVSLDDDEYLTIADPSHTLRDMRRELVAKRVCALTLTWRVYGASGHRCQPGGPLVQNFVYRALTEAEMSRAATKAAAQHEAVARHLNTPFGGKPVYIYRDAISPMCGTHWCDECPVGLHNCAQPRGAGEKCEKDFELTPKRYWINHYAFQSLAHWEFKKLRGRTNQLPSRTGGVPKSYERRLDRTSLELTRLRIARVQSPPLRTCLARLFEMTGPAATQGVSRSGGGVSSELGGLPTPRPQRIKGPRKRLRDLEDA